jgi:hypothetical protein
MRQIVDRVQCLGMVRAKHALARFQGPGLTLIGYNGSLFVLIQGTSPIPNSWSNAPFGLEVGIDE